MGHWWYISTEKNKIDVSHPLCVVLLRSHVIKVIFRALPEQIFGKQSQTLYTLYPLEHIFMFSFKSFCIYYPYMDMLMDRQQLSH